jgi:hypothetical protein
MDGVPPPIRKVVSMAVWEYVDIRSSCSSHTILLQLLLNHAIDGMKFYLFWDVSRLATLGLGLCDYIRVPNPAVLYLTMVQLGNGQIGQQPMVSASILSSSIHPLHLVWQVAAIPATQQVVTHTQT